jgi:transcriptional regulator with XRE-family HTH domain
MTVSKAVVALRKHLKQTQQRFATALDMSISALQNYEQSRMPESKQLLRFHRAAQEAGRDDLARVFLAAAQETLGLSGLGALYRPEPLGPEPFDRSGLGSAIEGGGRSPWKVRTLPPRDEFEQEAADAVLRCLRGSNQPAALRVVDAVSAAIEDPVRAQWFEDEAVRRNIITTAKAKRRKK